jgi:hypothetical protein
MEESRCSDKLCNLYSNCFSLSLQFRISYNVLSLDGFKAAFPGKYL